MKKDVIFIAMGLGLGGTECTLVEALNAIDYEKNNITLYLRKNRTVQLPLLNDKVKVIVNDKNQNDDYPMVPIFNFLINMFSVLRLSRFSDSLQKKKRKYALKKRRENEFKHFFSDKHIYDIAIAYDMANECAIFTYDYVQASKKFVFLHASNFFDKQKLSIFSKFDKIIGVNALVEQNVKTTFPNLAPKVISIENFIGAEQIRVRAKEIAIPRPSDNLVLCTCGRFTKEKGFDLAVEVARVLKDRKVSFKWFFVGDGIERDNIEKQIADCKVSDNIIITGFVDNPYVYMNICDIYVQPSIHEAHATTILESIILSKPIVSTNTTGGKYIFGKYPCAIITEINYTEIADGIIELFENKQMQHDFVEIENSIDWNLDAERYKRDINNLLLS